MRTEPVITVASLTALVAAGLGLLVAFGVDVTKDQQTAVMSGVAVLAPLVVAFLARRKVVPVDDSEGEPSNVPDYDAPGEQEV